MLQVFAGAMVLLQEAPTVLAKLAQVSLYEGDVFKHNKQGRAEGEGSFAD
jgi:hypothetical protein